MTRDDPGLNAETIAACLAERDGSSRSYRYERVIADIAALAPRILFDPRLGEAARRIAVDLTIGFFASGADLERAELAGARHAVPGGP